MYAQLDRFYINFHVLAAKKSRSLMGYGMRSVRLISKMLIDQSKCKLDVGYFCGKITLLFDPEIRIISENSTFESGP